jgi:hypothetical protein
MHVFHTKPQDNLFFMYPIFLETIFLKISMIKNQSIQLKK